MKIRIVQTLIAVALVWLSPFAACAQFTLSGVTLYLSQSDGTYFGGRPWNTRGSPDFFPNVYLFTGSVASPAFLNSGNADVSLNPNLSLSVGVHVIQFAGESFQPGLSIGLNLFFDGDLSTNRITAVVPGDGSTNFSAVAKGITTYGEDGTLPSSGALSYSLGQFTVILSDFHVTLPYPDLVSDTVTAPDGVPDTTGTFTLTVVPRSDLLLSIEVSEVRLCWPAEANKTYQVQYRSTLTTNLWADLGGPILGDGTRKCVTDPVPADRVQRFYQVVRLEP